ncbi:MAG: exodeoxyribonuclease III [Thermoprotei archaeon]
MTWNVNGLRAINRKGSLGEVMKFDVIMLQEIRTEVVPLNVLMSGYTISSFPAKKKGYSGVMTLTKERPQRVVKGIGMKEADEEGRVITVDLGRLYLVNAYFPRAGENLERLQFKVEFDKAIETFLKRLASEKPTMICGDFNAVFDRKDSTIWDESWPGLTPQEREWLNHMVNEEGWVDVFRKVNGNVVVYTWRSYLRKDVAMRIDHCLASSDLEGKLVKAEVLKVEGSDHYPLYVRLEV